MRNEEYKKISIDKIFMHEDNESIYYNADIEELAKSLKQHGQLNAIRISKISEHRYLIITGNRRYLAAHKLNMKFLKCIVMPKISKKEYLYYNLVDNIHHTEMPPSQIICMINRLSDLGEGREQIIYYLCKNLKWFQKLKKLCKLHIMNNEIYNGKEIIITINDLEKQINNMNIINNVDKEVLEEALKLTFVEPYDKMEIDYYLEHIKKLEILIHRKNKKKEIEIIPKNTIGLKKIQMKTILNAVGTVYEELGYVVKIRRIFDIKNYFRYFFEDLKF